MDHPHLIFVPGKNPKPPANQHRDLLWRTLLEGINRFNPKISDNLSHHSESFKLIAWNHLYYHCNKNINEDLPWIDALFKKAGPTDQDIQEASSTHR